MSVLTEAQRDYMDAVLRGNSFHDGIPNADVSPAPPAEVVKTPPHKVQPPPSRTPYFDTVLMDDDDTDRRGHGGKGNRNRGCKKGGRDGWGTPMDSVDAQGVMDAGDPNYDSTEDAAIEYVEKQSGDVVAEYKAKVGSIVDEYFSSADVHEACAGLHELENPLYQHFIVKKVITMAMDRKTRECEMAARLLSVLFPEIVSPDEMTKGFINLVKCAEDLALDVPEAATIIGVFIARAVVDDILPPAMIPRALSLLSEENKVAIESLNYCKVQLGARHAAERVLRLWGDSVGLTVDEAKKKVALLLKEYLDSSDVAEATECLRALKMPFFHHELVKKALVHAIEEPASAQAVMLLLRSMGQSVLISQTQMTMGFTRMMEAVEDLSLDVPAAGERFAELVAEAKSHKVLEEDFGNTPAHADVVNGIL